MPSRGEVFLVAALNKQGTVCAPPASMTDKSHRFRFTFHPFALWKP
jgi:hypothetical protein